MSRVWREPGMYCVNSVTPCSGSLMEDDEISRGAFAHRRGIEAFSSVVVLQRVEIAGLVANVHPAEGLRAIGLGIQLNILAVVDLDEGLGGFAGVGNGEGLLVAKLAQESDFAINITDAKGNVRDADDALIWRGRLGDQSCRARAGRTQAMRSSKVSRKFSKKPPKPDEGDTKGKVEKWNSARRIPVDKG